jgi:flagellar basal-body rod modification protein FlgD
MSIAATAAASQTSTQKSTGLSNTTVSKDDFLKLLVAQLQHQDPMNPQDPSQFVSELAQFTQVEQMTNMAASLDTMGTKTTAAQWISAIGKRVNVSGSTLSPSDELVMSPQSAYDSVTLTLTDKSTGAVTTKTYKSGDKLAYTNDGNSTLTASAAATYAGASVACGATVLKTLKGVGISSTGNTLVFGDGSTIDSSGVTVITDSF